MTDDVNTISLETAQNWARRWRGEEGTYNKHHELHAFLIPKVDLMELLDAGTDAVRAYIGVNENNVEKLMLVGTKYDETTDIYIDKLPGRPGANGNIYDFTRPCPPFCDPESELNNLSRK